MEAQEYENLVEALRHCSGDRNCQECEYDTMLNCADPLKADAADAIEALQAEVYEANKSADAYRSMYFAKHGDITIEKVRELDEIDCHFHSALIRLMYRRIEELEAQLSKRGKWIVTTETSDDGAVSQHINCSVCGFYWREPKHGKVFKRCPNCGADMRKMEVQDGQ